MQMYRVHFVTHWESYIERGDYLICSDSIEQAQNSVALYLNLPRSRTQFETARVKPSIHKLEHTEQPIGDKASKRNLGLAHGRDRPVEREQVTSFHLKASAVIRARSPEQAFRRFNQATSTIEQNREPRQREGDAEEQDEQRSVDRDWLQR